MAFVWIIDDEYTLETCDAETLYHRYALAVFYFATNGMNWYNSENWLSNKSECEWFGVKCNDVSLMMNSLRLGEYRGTPCFVV